MLGHAWQHNTCNVLGCKILWGPFPTAWDQKGLCFQTKTFLVLTGVYKNALHHSPCMHLSIHLPTKPMHYHLHACTFQQLMHLLVYTIHALPEDRCISFSCIILSCCKGANFMWKIYEHYLINISECCSYLPSTVVLPSYNYSSGCFTHWFWAMSDTKVARQPPREEWI